MWSVGPLPKLERGSLVFATAESSKHRIIPLDLPSYYLELGSVFSRGMRRQRGTDNRTKASAKVISRLRIRPWANYCRAVI